MERLVVVGGPGSGKSTVATRIAERLNAGHTELDAIWWGPDWTPIGRDALRSEIEEVVAASRWVIDGNYIDEIADVAWPRADLIVWLDLPRRVAVGRAIRRSTRRVVTSASLWNANHESISVLSPRSLTSFVRRWPEYPDRITTALSALEVPQERVARLCSDVELEQWLAAL